MILDDLLYKVPDKLFAPAESLHVSGTVEKDAFTVGPDTFALAQPITWEADVTNTGNALLVAGKAYAEVTCACARCLEECEYILDGDIEAYYLIPGEEDTLSEDEEEEFDVLPEDDVVNFEDLIMGALILEIPVLPLCDDDCKGLCPDCGVNLNNSECICSGETKVDPLNPFAALAGLSFD